MPAGIVGVLAEDLDPSRREAAPLRRALEDRRRLLLELGEERGARGGIRRRHAERLEVRRDRIHGRASRPASRALTMRHVGSPRQIEDRARGAERLEHHAPRDRQAHRFRQLVLAARRQRHIAARVEDALVESPHVHADERARSRAVEIIAARFLDDARQAAAVIDFDRGKAHHAVSRKAALAYQRVGVVRRQPGTVELDRARAATGAGYRLSELRTRNGSRPA